MNFRSTTRQDPPSVFKKKVNIVNFEDTTLFPDLIQDKNTARCDPKSYSPTFRLAPDLDFLQASMKEAPKEEILDKKWELKPGWVQITVDDNNHIITRKHEDDVEYIQTDSEIFEEEVQQTLEILINTWDNYRRTYIESYGEDDYEKYYMFKNE